MSDIWLRLVERLVRTWTRLYTIGVAPDLRDRRRAEIESDLWESRHQPQRPYTAAHVLLRLLLGVRDDVAWRSSCRRPSKVTRAAVAGLIAASIFVSGMLFAIGRAAVLPEPAPPAPHVRAPPPPPPPPPPPCAPAGSGHESPSPCSRQPV
jgi:hypothetical protein